MIHQDTDELSEDVSYCNMWVCADFRSSRAVFVVDWLVRKRLSRVQEVLHVKRSKSFWYAVCVFGRRMVWVCMRRMMTWLWFRIIVGKSCRLYWWRTGSTCTNYRITNEIASSVFGVLSMREDGKIRLSVKSEWFRCFYDLAPRLECGWMECGSKFEVMDVMSRNIYNRDIRDVILIEEGLNTKNSNE